MEQKNQRPLLLVYPLVKHLPMDHAFSHCKIALRVHPAVQGVKWGALGAYAHQGHRTDKNIETRYQLFYFWILIRQWYSPSKAICALA